MMRTVLGDMALEVEGAVALTLRLCRAYDRAAEDSGEAAFARLMTPVVKYWVCKIAPALIAEAMECIGGNAYVEDSLIARLYREAPVNAIWEGSGNVMCLDVLRALTRESEASHMVLARLFEEATELPGVAYATRQFLEMLKSPTLEAHARAAVERLALVAAAAALRASAPPEIGQTFAKTRLTGRTGPTFGSVILSSLEAKRLIDRALPSE